MRTMTVLEKEKTLSNTQKSGRVCDYDRMIAAKLLELRIHTGLSQQEMAKALDVTYQQAHKYEKGENRISAGKLAALCQSLGIDINYFYAGIVPGSDAATPPRREDMETANAIGHIKSPTLRQSLRELILTLAERM